MPEDDDKNDLSKVLESFNSKLSKFNNDATALAQQLFTENYGLREDKRKLKAEVEDLKGKAPADGSLILTPTDAKIWEEIKALNLSASQIKEKLQSSDSAAAELATLKRKELIREAAEAEGYKATVLNTLLPADISVELKDVEKDGKTRRAAFVKVGDKESPLSEYIQTTHADFLPALKAEPATQTRFVRQDTKGKAPSANRYDRIREETKARQEAQKQDSKPLEQRLGMA